MTGITWVNAHMHSAGVLKSAAGVLKSASYVGSLICEFPIVTF